MARKKKKKTQELRTRIDPIKKANTVDVFTPENIQELSRCANDFIYFATKYIYVQHPVKGQILFEPYPYQIEMLQAIVDYKQLVFMCGRQLGKCIFYRTSININNEKKQIGNLLWNEFTLKEKLITVIENCIIKLKMHIC